MKDLSDAINEWLSKYEEGEITLCELFGLMFYHITMHPEDIAATLAALRSHSDPDVKSIIVDINTLLRDRENR